MGRTKRAMGGCARGPGAIAPARRRRCRRSGGAARGARRRALAADPPTMLTARHQRPGPALLDLELCAPGTTFDFVTLATVPDPDPALPTFFADDNFAGFCSAKAFSDELHGQLARRGYASPPRPALLREGLGGRHGHADYVTSGIWVIDDAKPQIPGDAGVGAIPPTGTPVAGHPLGTAPRRPCAAAATAAARRQRRSSC